MKNLLPFLIVLFLVGCAIKPPPVITTIDNIQIPSSWSKNGIISLHDGSYKEEAAPGSARQIIIEASGWSARGRIDSTNVFAIILISAPGGSGTFYDLLLFKETGEHLLYLAQVPLGDRIQINRLTITDNMVKVSLAAHNTDAPMTEEPDLPLTKSFVFADTKLTEPCTPEPATTTIAPPPASFAGKTFFWQSSLYGNDTQESPSNETNYLITFNKDWTLAIHSDCNKITGIFGINGSQLTIRPEIVHGTCGTQSLSPVFLRDLGDASHFLFQDQNLYIDLIYDSGTMILRCQP
ncbi:MAG: META domain-containing protein [Spirochaetales bacterium]|jgi:heat shock protein HslJ|nr:META domain-containing protein [Spirochaetales bacterium]